MEMVSATDLKNRLGHVLAKAQLGPVGVVRHGRLVAYLSPAAGPTAPKAASGHSRASPETLGRADEERFVDLVASGDLRPSRWRRAGDHRLLAGLAVMLASQPEFDRVRLLNLAEQLHPGMSTLEGFSRWLPESPVRAARFLPMVRAARKSRRP